MTDTKSPVDPATALVTEFLLKRTDGVETLLTVSIGFPFEQNGSWRSPCGIDGWRGAYPDIHGATSIQAMALALRLIRSELGTIITKGNRLCLPSDRVPLTGRLLDVLFGVYGEK